MGRQHEFICKACRYSAVVCDGEQIGFEVVMEGRVCTTCREIVDVVVGAFHGDSVANMNECPECGATNTEKWKDHACPKCGGVMTDEGTLSVLWD